MQEESQLSQTQSNVSEYSQQGIIGKPDASAKKVSQSTNNTFSMNSIIPIIRTVQIHQYCYAIYSTLHKIPLAVHEFIDKTMVEGNASREGKDFYQHQTADPNDSKFFPDGLYYDKPQAYKTMSYDKGHMAPANNYLGNQNFLDSTFTYANCVPQDSYFNRGSWKNLESYTRNLLRNNLCQTVEVISGPIFYSDLPHSKSQFLYQNRQVVMLQHGIVVPPKCFKIIKANKSDCSYLSIFVLRNQKVIDNQFTLKSFTVSLDELQLMTGLRFNLGKYRPLQDLDPTLATKTMGDLHLDFFTRLFMRAQTLADMNGARKQGFQYKVKVDVNCISNADKVKMAEREYKSILDEKQQKYARAKCRRKINSLLGLHKDSKQLKALSQELQKNIINSIKDYIEQSKAENERFYHRLIAKKIYEGNNQYYSYPCVQQLKAAFSNILEKKQEIANGQQQTNINQIQSNVVSVSNITPKKTKTTKKQTKETDQHKNEQTPTNKTENSQPESQNSKPSKKKKKVEKQDNSNKQVNQLDVQTNNHLLNLQQKQKKKMKYSPKKEAEDKKQTKTEQEMLIEIEKQIANIKLEQTQDETKKIQ